MLFDLAAPFTLAMQAAQIGMEAQAVIALRMAGFAGLWQLPPEEATRMVVEKAEAAVDAFSAVTQAAFEGAAPETVLAAGMSEIGRRTAGNLERLSRLAPMMRA